MRLDKPFSDDKLVWECLKGNAKDEEGNPERFIITLSDLTQTISLDIKI